MTTTDDLRDGTIGGNDDPAKCHLCGRYAPVRCVECGERTCWQCAGFRWKHTSRKALPPRVCRECVAAKAAEGGG